MIFYLLISLPFSTASNITVERIPSTGTPPSYRLYIESVHLDGSLYFFGGRNTSGDTIDEFHAFHIEKKIW